MKHAFILLPLSMLTASNVMAIDDAIFASQQAAAAELRSSFERSQAERAASNAAFANTLAHEAEISAPSRVIYRDAPAPAVRDTYQEESNRRGQVQQEIDDEAALKTWGHRYKK